MEKEYDLSPEAFSEFRQRPLVYLMLRSNNWISALGPLYLLWRGERQRCCRIYLPILSLSAVAFGLMGFGLGAQNGGWYQAGVGLVCLCLLWGIGWNIRLSLQWNDQPHSRQRALLPAVLWLAAAVGLPLLAMQLGCVLGAQ